MPENNQNIFKLAQEKGIDFKADTITSDVENAYTNTWVKVREIEKKHEELSTRYNNLLENLNRAKSQADQDLIFAHIARIENHLDTIEKEMDALDEKLNTLAKIIDPDIEI